VPVSSELRTDPLTGQKVLIAAHREERPHDFGRRQYERLAIDCPFCPGHEDQTPVELLLATTDLAPAGRKNWQVRVVPNKYPALAVAAPVARPSQGGPMADDDATGIQEVIIESPRHIVSLAELSAAEAEAVFLVYRRRMQAIRETRCGEHLLAFKNVGPGAGSSVEHTHSQLIALPHMPEQIRGHVLRAAEHLTATGQALWDDLLAAERADGRRIIAETKHLVAFCPYASRVAYETRIVPKSPALRYEEQPEAIARECAVLAHSLVRKLERELDRPDYNYLLFTAPASVTDERHYRWHLLLFPRLTVQAGFEWGTGMFINSVAPEEAAAALRA
jgi:UDPglucose--hexose-1-phosphate uridylyltransferase